jgi:uncharacterized phiE125 gp8 family phage protein
LLGAPVLVTAPTAELITIDQAKAFLRVDGHEQDVEIGMLAAAAVGDVEDDTGLRLLNQTVKVTADSFEDLAHLRVGPVRAIASISYRDAGGNDQVLAPERFELFGGPFEQGVRAVGSSWPAIGAGGALIEVGLDVGYGDTAAEVPAKLRFAAFAKLRGKFEDVEVDVEPLIANHRFWL